MIGVIQLINKQPIGMPFTETDEDLISAFSAQIGMCIEHCTDGTCLGPGDSHAQPHIAHSSSSLQAPTTRVFRR